MQTQVLTPAKQLLLLDAKSTQDIEFLLPETNEYHTVTVISKQYNYKNKQLLTVEDKLPILVNYRPTNLHAEFSCKRFFISELIKRIKFYLICKYKFFFSIKTVKQLELNIIRDIDVFDSSQSTFTMSAKLTVEYHKSGDKYNTQDNWYTETFSFSSCSLLGDIVLEKSSTLPPDIWNELKNLVVIPKNTEYLFNGNIISFVISNINYKFDIETKELVN